MMAKPRRQELAERAMPIWWAAAMNRFHDQTGAAHAIHEGGTLCGARPFTTGGSYTSAAATGCRECRRCRKIIDDVVRTSTETVVTGVIRYPNKPTV